jgi:ABC-type lipoprotein release transport system permease subunit
MAKKKVLSKSAVKTQDFSSWNFILFLTLAFILLVVMLSAMTGVSRDLRSKAGLSCPEVTLPRAEDCAGGWKYQRDITNGCPTFVCEAK